MISWSPGRSIFRSFFRFDFGLDFGLVLDPFGGRLGLLLAPFWRPNRVKFGQKCVLSGHFVENADFHADLRFPILFGLF